MPDLTTLDGGSISIEESTVRALAVALEGRLLTPNSPGYDDARSIWNAMIDRRPGLIAECAGVHDVVEAVAFAREHGVLLSVCGAGHNIAGSAVCDGGLMISFKRLRGVEVDAESRLVRVQPGATLGDLDAATQAFGLAVPTGINSTTGVAGLTLGGGFGWLSRKHGMTIDNLVSVNLVTAAGRRVVASETENTDLFWGLRGGRGELRRRDVLRVHGPPGGSRSLLGTHRPSLL